MATKSSSCAGMQKPAQLDNLAAEDRAVLAELFSIAEGDDQKRHALVDLLASEEKAEGGAHLFEIGGDVAPVFFAGVGDDAEVLGLDFDPLRFAGECGLCEQQGEHESGNR